MKVKHTVGLFNFIVSLGLVTTMLVASSMVTLAASTKPVGELIVTTKSDKFVTVNGEPSTTGRTIFASSTISTPEGMTASISFGKAGRIDLAPGSTFTLDSDAANVGGELAAGSLTVVNTSAPIKVMAGGKSVVLSAGETATTAGKADDDYRDSNGKCIDADKDGKEECSEGGGVAWWAWALIFGAAATTIVWLAADRNNDGPQTSPVR